MSITNNHGSVYMWWKENLVKHQKVSKYYNHDCPQNFILLFMPSLKVPIVKKVIFWLELTLSF